MSEAEGENEGGQAKAGFWKINENRPLAPFLQEKHALEQTGFSPFKDSEPEPAKSIFYVPDDFSLEDFKPSFILAVDVPKIIKTTEFSADALVVNITARDHGTKNYRCIRSWPLPNYPDRYECADDDIRGLSPNERLTFCVVVSLPAEIPRQFGRPHYKASILAEKTFTLQKEPESPSFPTKPVPPEFFENHGLPGESLWLVDFNGDVHAAPEEAIAVYINENAVKKLNKAFGGNVAGGLLRNQMAAEIFFDVCQKTLHSTGGENPEEGSLLYQIRRCFRAFEYSPVQLAEMANEPGGARLRCLVQAFLNLTRKIETADLRRPWQR